MNSVDIYGPKVVLVNFDDRCELEEYEDQGIFLEVGDILIITARQDAAANQEWVIPEECEHYWDEGILAFLSFSDEKLSSHYDFVQNILAFEAFNAGVTRIDFVLEWGGLPVRHVSLDVYVGMRPSLQAVVTPRHCCDWCGDGHSQPGPCKKNTFVTSDPTINNIRK